MSNDVWIWVAGVGGTIVSGAWATVAGRRQNKAKAKFDEVAAYSQLFRDLQERNEQLEARANRQDQQITALYRELNQLRALLVRNGIPLPAVNGGAGS